MTSTIAYALTASTLIAIGFYGFLTHQNLLRQILAVNIISSGVFLMFGALSHRTGQAGGDPVPQAIIITGIVVAMSTTALAVALLTRLHEFTHKGILPDEVEGHDDG